jgi:hypothetical protein
MKKLLLLLSITLTLFGCSIDRNMDGEFTISDVGLALKDYLIAFQDYLIPFGEPVLNALNLFLNSGFGAFLELETINPDRSFMLGLGLLSFSILITFEAIILYVIYLVLGSWTGEVKESWQEIKQEFNQESQSGRLKKIYKSVKQIIWLIFWSALILTIISFIIYAIICSLTALEYNY